MSAEHLPHRAGTVRGESPEGLAAVLNLPGRVRSPHHTEHLAGMGSKGSNTASEVVRLPSDSGFAEFSDLAELVDLAESLEPGRFRDIDDRDLTVLILAEHHVPGLGWFSRALGINAALSVADTVRSILLSLEWPGAATMLTPESGCTGHGCITTWSLQTRREDRLRVYSRTAGSIATPLYEALGSDGTGVLTVDGYTVMVTTTGAVPRDGHTPEAVCLAGTFAPDNPDSPDNSGKSDSLSIPAPGVVDHPVGLPRDVDLAAVNVALTGEETVAEILDGLAPELRSLLLAGDLFEFTPLLQALDLGRPAQISAATRQVLEAFPVETSRIGRAAAWSRVVALSTLSDRSAADEVTAMLMTALGFVRADADLGPSAGRLSGDPLDATEIRALSQQSGHLLAMCGADVWEDRDDLTWGDSSPIDGPAAVIPLVPKRSLVDRLEMYRFLLQDRKT